MDSFNARNFEPQFGGMGGHPCGMFDFFVSNTYGKNTKDNEGGMLVVELTSPAGRIDVRFNLFNKSAEAVAIANKQLSALCHVTGVFNLSFPRGPNGEMTMFAAELRNARLKGEVAFQKGQEPTPENPRGGYVEVKRIFDVNGNEPGKAGAAPQPQTMPQGQAMPPPQQQPPQGQWGAPQPNGQPPQQQPVQGAPGGWQQQPPPQGQATTGGAPASPPWGQSR